MSHPIDRVFHFEFPHVTPLNSKQLLLDGWHKSVKVTNDVSRRVEADFRKYDALEKVTRVRLSFPKYTNEAATLRFGRNIP